MSDSENLGSNIEVCQITSLWATDFLAIVFLASGERQQETAEAHLNKRCCCCCCCSAIAIYVT